MIRTTLAAAAATLATAVGFAPAAAASRPDVPISATYNLATQRYCVRATTFEQAAALNMGMHQRQCMTARQWRLHGVTFDAPVREPRIARM